MSDIRTGLRGRLPSGDANGLADFAPELVKDPHRMRAALVLFDVEDVSEKVRKGYSVAFVSIRRIELVSDADDAAAVQRILMREFERRSGLTVLPIDLEEDVESAFADIVATIGRDDRERAEEPPQHEGANDEFADELRQMNEELNGGDADEGSQDEDL